MSTENPYFSLKKSPLFLMLLSLFFFFLQLIFNKLIVMTLGTFFVSLPVYIILPGIGRVSLIWVLDSLIHSFFSFNILLMYIKPKFKVYHVMVIYISICNDSHNRNTSIPTHTYSVCVCVHDNNV